jgi:hypothetical protein
VPPASQRFGDHNADRPFDGLTQADRPKGVTILGAFNLACKRDELEVAALLLVEYERIVTRLPISLDGARRTEMTNLVEAHARLWGLLQASVDECQRSQ